MSAATTETFEVVDLDPAGVLAAIAENEREIRVRELHRLELAHQWAVLHPALDVAEEAVGGDGTPEVAEFAPEALAVALGISPHSARSLMADALDLVHRLPNIWRRVRRFTLLAWQARRIAQQTRPLARDAAAWVDERVTTRSTVGPRTLDGLVADAIARFDPAEHARREDRAKASWDVVLTHPGPTEVAGTSELWARGDTAALQALYDQICTRAHQAALDGDPDHLGARKAKALTDLIGGEQVPDKVRLYFHVNAADLDHEAIGQVERLGPATLTKLKDWIATRRVTVLPVLDPSRTDAVDHHDPPPWMRELVIL
ncbi:MAG: DUF222 domain-containing protein, partial [Nocardioides sp.]